MKYGAYLVAVALIFVVSGCNGSYGYKGAVIQELPNPDNTVIAVVTKVEASAVTPAVMRIYLRVVRTNRVQRMLLADMTIGMKLHWQDNDLVVDLPCAHIEAFRNFIELKDSSHDYAHTVAIKLTNNGVCMKSFGYHQ